MGAAAGSLRFAKQNDQLPLIHSGGGSWTEVYSGADYVEDVPFTEFVVHRISANRNFLKPSHCDTCYNSKFPAADCFVSPEGALNLFSGLSVAQRHAAQKYTIPA